MKLSRIALGALVAGAAIVLTACAGGTGETATPDSTPIGGDIVAPVTVSANDLQGETIDLTVGQTLNIDTGDLAVDSYSGEVADANVAEFVAGREESSATFNPGVRALAQGSTTVTMTNADGGIQPLEFTVVVTAD